MALEEVYAPQLVAAKGISVRFGDTHVLDPVDIAVSEGEIVTVIGPNGSGKTTLVRVLIGLIEPDAGRVWRRPGLTVGYVPQRLHIDPTMPLTVGRFMTLSRAMPRSDIVSVLDEVGAARVIERPVQTISGGEMRRVLLARALLRQPDLLVLDEPAAGVDVTGQGELYGLIKRIRDRRGSSVLLVSHNLHFVMAATDQVVCINRHVCCHGQPEAVRRHPEYLALFGPEVEAGLAVYTHVHDHRHAPSGEPVSDPEQGQSADG